MNVLITIPELPLHFEYCTGNSGEVFILHRKLFESELHAYKEAELRGILNVRTIVSEATNIECSFTVTLNPVQYSDIHDQLYRTKYN